MSMPRVISKARSVALEKNSFQFVGVLRVADTVAQQDHAVFYVSSLPRVQEMVGGGQGKHVTRVGGSFLLGRMAVRSSPDWCRQKKGQKEKTCC